MSCELKLKRARKLGVLTRTRNRATILIDTHGTREQANDILMKLDEAMEALQEAGDEYTLSLSSDEEVAASEEYIQEAEISYRSCHERLREYLVSLNRSTPEQQPLPPVPTFAASLPRLTLPTFTGKTSEWPRWYALFESLVHNQPSLTDTERMIHLQSSVSGTAAAVIEGMLYDGSLYAEALSALRNRFGRQEDVVHASLKQLLSSSPPSYLDPVSLEKFHSSLHCTVTVLTKHGYVGDLESSENLRRVVAKLPRELKRDWAEHVMNMEPNRPTLAVLEKWLEKQVRIALNFAAVSGEKAQDLRRQANAKMLQSPVKRTLLASTVSSCTLCDKEHNLWQCDTFRGMPVDERAQFVATNKRCYSCLRTGHRAAQCRFRKACVESGCKMNHHRLLHGSQRVSLPRMEKRNARDEAPQRAVTSTSCRYEDARKTTLLQVVPVKVLGAGGKCVTTCARLDPGAQTTLCVKGLADQLGIEGIQEDVQLQTVQGPATVQMLHKVPLKLQSIDGKPPIEVDEAYAVKDLNIHVPFINKKERKRWPHLAALPISDCSGMKVELLLGANVLEAVVQEDVRRGRPGEPVAIKTAFGWALTGSVTDFVPEPTRQVMFLNKQIETDDIRAEMKTWWETECFGTKYNDEVSLSAEDRRALSSLEMNTKKREDGRYETGLLWRDHDVSLPDNRAAALQRLSSTERSLRRDEQKANEYADVLMGYVTKGHAKILTPAEAAEKNKRQWILPHHGVVNPSKDKIRVVFDAAAAYRGVSLNDRLLSGPDLLQSLAGVLIRFREEKVAIMADIEEMFHRVLIREEDQPALRFYWRDLDASRPPDVYQMRVAIFGAKCSPAIANYVLHKAADDAVEHDPDLAEAAETIKKNFYMDDMAKSVPDVESAVALGQDVSHILSNGGFRLTKWSSNRPQALRWISAADRAMKMVDFSLLSPNSVKALGCSWSPSSDLLCIQWREQEVTMTKRGMLKCTASIFDPLGLVSPFVVRAKILLQRLWSLNLNWDQPLEGEVLHAWEAWLSERSSLTSIKTPRCYKYDIRDPVSRTELHVFGDASQEAFAAVAYLRQVSSGGKVSCSLVMSRTRSAPLKQISIVRLEVQAAVLAVRLGRTLRREISAPLNAVCYWTDSKAVLHYIRNESKRFHTFVANRIAEIRGDSEVSEWRHVPGLLNPADLGSRGCSAGGLLGSDLWWKGPAFLTQGPDHWPEADIPDALLDDADPEVKVARKVLATVTPTQQALPDPGRFSSWLRYKRTVAWMLRFLRNVQRKKKTSLGGVRVSSLQSDEIQAAESLIIKERQRLFYGEEIRRIEEGHTLAASSRLKALSPFVDENGMIRARGRIGDAPIPHDTRHPIILEGSDPVTTLIIQDAHKRAMHAGTEHTLCEVRSRFWVQKGRTFVKRALKHCKICHKRRVQPQQPLMASLPRERLEDTRPFNNIGIDYLGPLYVKKFRRTEKRYVLLITCLSTRAVHLEVSCTLDIESLLVSLRRFFCRRGTPSVIWSDNGSSFVAGEGELKGSLQSMDQDRINDAMTKDHIKWIFNPPSAPHMGGCWERMVAAVKRPLRVVLGSSVVDDEVLQTVLCEVEFMVNSRPITYISSDVTDFSPLTPNHFLLGYPFRGVPPSVITSCETIGKRKWRHACSLADHLWQRWKREYVPTLLSREKWTSERPVPGKDDVVLIVDDDLPRGQWRLGKVMETFPGRDGIVRSVLLKTGNGRELVRPVSKLCPLEEAK